MSVEELQEFIRIEVTEIIENMDFGKKKEGGYSSMIYLFLFQTLLKVVPPLLENFMAKQTIIGQPNQSKLLPDITQQSSVTPSTQSFAVLPVGVSSSPVS